MEKIGICGGTFNPIHNGHLLIAEIIRESFNLNKILFIPSGRPPHKIEQEICSSRHRLKMINLAIYENNYFEVEDIETIRDGYTYSIDTLLLLHEKYKEAEFYYIVGADVILDLVNWKDIEKISKLSKFIAIYRLTNEIDDFNRQIIFLKEKYNLNILEAKGILFDISSSDLRYRIKKGLTIKYLVPDSVEKYIKENKLYI